jgi:hypothetical protein
MKNEHRDNDSTQLDTEELAAAQGGAGTLAELFGLGHVSGPVRPGYHRELHALREFQKMSPEEKKKFQSFTAALFSKK